MNGEITEAHRNKLRSHRPHTWATIIPRRRTNPVVKTHSTFAHAKNAVSATGASGYNHPYQRERGGYPCAEAEVYELRRGEWQLMYRIEDGTYPNELPWK